MKKYPTLADIAEMKARGYDIATIAAAREQCNRWPEAQRIIEMIREAFAGVTLGDGVGLRETSALDDYADAATCAAIRADDEKEDWQRISAEQLNMVSGFSFFDAEGARFHLPAFLIADIKGESIHGMEFHLTHLDDYHRAKFALLSAAQRRAVRAFLLFILDDPDEAHNRDEIQRALDECWTEPS